MTVNGESLAELIRRHAPLALSKRLAIVEQVCAALTYAHKAGVVHGGIILYHLISYRMPFSGPPIEAMIKVIRDAVPPLSDVAPGTDPELERIVLRMLERDPARRYQDVAAVGEELSAVRHRLE